ncbi:hypothetical protein N7466_003555 [Penicillium verhagenii]|uniref:uncharacterized protein n=1 Tax=Penicillium verhagenii TaxID=1562060 RepID=UPI0025458C70|nr:uncharacterized protein N7466_003555 [Penicillium verhagenii]KAJ5937105.1 hypothetical protein N7466_003555 [Penicillium verhagenii]
MSTVTLLARPNSCGSDLELAYASPAVFYAIGADDEIIQCGSQKKNRSSSFTTESGSLSEHHRRTKRLRGSSDDNGELTSDGFSNEDLRVGGPDLCSLPAANSTPTDNLLHRRLSLSSSWDRTLHNNNIDNILKNYNVQYHTVEVVERRALFNASPEAVITLLIIAERDCVRELRRFLHDEGFPRTVVEISDTAALTTPNTTPVFFNDPVFEKWDSVWQQICQEVPLVDIETVGCFRRGRNPVVEENPATVLVSTNMQNNRNWKGVRDRIIDILQQHDLAMVAFEITKDTGFHQRSGFDHNILTGKVMAGESLAPLRAPFSPGTLGGFIELKSAIEGTDQWVAGAVTCFHCVLPRDSEEDTHDHELLRQWESDGMHMHPEANRLLKISHPSLQAKTEEMARIQQVIDNTKTLAFYKHGALMAAEGCLEYLPEADQIRWRVSNNQISNYEAMISPINTFVNDGHQEVGSVFLASGMKLRKFYTMTDCDLPTHLDWAVIRVDRTKVQGNKLEKMNTPPDLAQPPDYKSFHGSDVFLHGFRSGQAMGYYNGLKSVVIKTDLLNETVQSVKTLEYSVTPPTGRSTFTLAGDSGSFVYSPAGLVLGMIFAGSTVDGIGYFRRMDHLFDDIKATSGAADIRLYAGDAQV